MGPRLQRQRLRRQRLRRQRPRREQDNSILHTIHRSQECMLVKVDIYKRLRWLGSINERKKKGDYGL
jgi:hypothetical protein